MGKFLGVDVAKILGQTFGSKVSSVTLVKVVAWDRQAGQLTSGVNPTTQDYSARGFVEDYKDQFIDGTIIQRGDRKITLLGDTIASKAIPEAGDKLRIGEDSLVIVNVARDPASATYTCQARK